MADSTTPPSRRALKAHSVGPRLAATLAYLAGSHRASNRGLEEITEDVFDVPIALGTVANLRTEVSDALAPAHAEAVQVVRAAAVKNVDETSWKLAGTLCWLWVAATNTVAAFLIHAHRGWDALAAVLGEKVRGLVCSDRWSVYDRLSPFCRQVCWANLKRDFQKLVDRGGAAAPLGRRLQRVAERVFVDGTCSAGAAATDRSCNGGWTARHTPWSGLSRRGGGARTSKAATFFANVLALLPAVWRFVVSEGVEPTNNHAERVLRRGCCRGRTPRLPERGGVPFRGTDDTVVQTRRLQGRSVLDYLYDALVTSQRPPRTFSTCGRLIGYRLTSTESVPERGPSRHADQRESPTRLPTRPSTVLVAGYPLDASTSGPEGDHGCDGGDARSNGAHGTPECYWIHRRLRVGICTNIEATD